MFKVTEYAALTFTGKLYFLRLYQPIILITMCLQFTLLRIDNFLHKYYRELSTDDIVKFHLHQNTDLDFEIPLTMHVYMQILS